MEIVPVLYHNENEGWWADSPSIPEWTATAPSFDELHRLVEEGVRFALERDDVIVEHRLEYGMAAHAEVVFDFVGHRTVINQGLKTAHRAHLTQAA